MNILLLASENQTRKAESPDAALLRLADLAIDRQRGKAHRQGIDLGLSATQFELLDVLMTHRGRVMSRAGLIEAVWGSSANHHQRENIVTVAILRLRQRLDDPFDLKLIHTVYRKGYVLELRNDPWYAVTEEVRTSGQPAA